MVKVYTLKEAIGEIDAIRMEADRSDQDKSLSMLVAELASVLGWIARHIDRLEEEIISDISFECDDGSVKKSDLFEVATLDGENSHPGMKR